MNKIKIIILTLCLIGGIIMGYTEKTPNFDLPLYAENDKPTYLGDWNYAMGDIDTNMKTIKDDGISNGVAIANMKEYVDNNVANMNATVDSVRADMNTLSNDMNTLSNDMSSLSTELRAEIQTFEEGVNSKLKFNSPKRVVIVGDSYCVDEANRNGIVTQLQSIAPNWTITSVADIGACYTWGGVLGRTFTDQVNYAATLIDPNTVDYVLIIGGRNEAGGQTSPNLPTSQVQVAAEQCYAAVKQKFPNAKPFVFAMPYDWKHPNYNIVVGLNYINEACVKYNVWSAEGCFTWGLGDEASMYIGGNDIHPNSAGSLYMAHKIYSAVINNNVSTWRERTWALQSLSMVLTKDKIAVKGAVTATGGNNIVVPKASLPKWAYPAGSLGGVQPNILLAYNATTSTTTSATLSDSYGITINGSDVLTQGTTVYINHIMSLYY